MKSSIWLNLFAGLVLISAGCAGKGYVKASAVRPTLRSLIERHDRYVRSDDLLDSLERGIYLRDGELILKALEEAEK